jgi:hypothetical protein
MTGINHLGNLEVEILSIMQELVIDSHPASARDIALVNKRFYSTYRLVGHRNKTITFNNSRGVPGKCTLVKLWLEDEELLRGVRHLTIVSKRDCYEEPVATTPEEREQYEASKYDDLLALINLAGNLRTLVWSAEDPIPASILSALESRHKNLSLRITNWSRWDDSGDHSDPSETALAKCSALTSIRATIWGGGGGRGLDLREVALKRIIASAPNLQHASIITGSCGCVVYFPSEEERQQVKDMSAHFYTHKRPNSALRSLTLDGYGLDKHTLQEWAKFVDLSKLTALKCSRGMPDISYFIEAPKMLHSLKHVSLNLGRSNQAVSAAAEAYLTNCAPLETLSLWSWNGIISLDTVLANHGATLTKLELHERETTEDYGETRRILLTADQVQQIAAACPKLMDFTFDLHRHTLRLETELEEDADIFRTLKSMNLNRLQIYYDLGLPHLVQSDRMPLPGEREGDDTGVNLKPKPLSISPNWAIQTFADASWSAIFASRTHGARVLDLKFGEYEKKLGAGYPCHWALSEQRLKTFWSVRPCVRDDQLDQCTVKRHGNGHDVKRPEKRKADTKVAELANE